MSDCNHKMNDFGDECINCGKDVVECWVDMQERIATLESWKKDALIVLCKWDEIFVQAEIPCALGELKSNQVLNEITHLRNRIAELEKVAEAAVESYKWNTLGEYSGQLIDALRAAGYLGEGE